VFDRNVQGYAETEFYQDLRAFTASFWLKVKKEIETGTVMSYSFGDEDCKFVFYYIISYTQTYFHVQTISF